MYSVLLVDDEQWIIKGLNCGVNWDKYELTVIGEARNGIEALHFIEEHHPDIVITDIQMPGMNGLELIKNSKTLSPSTLFILLSGHAEFSYAQKALTYGVYNYCLKPFELEDLEATLCRAVKDINKQRYSLYDSHYISDTLLSNNTEAIKDILNSKNLIISESNPLITLVSVGSEKVNLEPSLIHISFKTGYQRIAFIIQYSDLEKATKYLSTLYSDLISLGVGNPVTDCFMIDASLDAATTAAYSIFITGKHGIYSLPVSNEHTAINEILSRLLIGMKNVEYSQICFCIDLAKAEIETNHLSIQYAYTLYNIVHYMMQNDSVNLYNNYIGDYEKLYFYFGTFENMIENLKSFAFTVCNNSKNIVPVENTTLKEILKYINEHLKEDLSIYDISNKFYISGSYLSQLFKKEVGTNFVDYISRSRIDFACNLLTNTDKQIQEIGQECGYNDYCYFAKVFKRYRKLTPSEYRSQNDILINPVR